MCGIGGFCLNPKDHGQIDPDLLAGYLLIECEARGKHASGAAWLSNGKVRSKKAAVPASTWVKHGHHKSEATSRILHTRYATKGSPANPLNNHPIKQGTIIGTHNGTLDYGHDDDLFAMLGDDVDRHGEVDSEAIFALLAHGDLPVTDALEMLHGRIALAWYDTRDSVETLHLARGHGSPLAVGQTKNGSFVYGSTMHILKEAVDAAGVKLEWTQDLPEGTYLQIQQGVIVSSEVFEPVPAAPRVRVNASRPKSKASERWTLGTGAAKSKAKGKAKSKGKGKARRTAKPHVIAGYDFANGVYTNAPEVVPVSPSEWEWDDREAVAEMMAEADEQLMWGESQ